MTNDILILAAGLGDVANAGLGDASYSGYDILADKHTTPFTKFDPKDKETFKSLAIFKPIEYVLRTVSLFMLLLFGYKLIAGITKGAGKVMEAFKGSIGYLIAAILLWDIMIFINLLGLVTSFAQYIGSTISTLVDNAPPGTKT